MTLILRRLGRGNWSVVRLQYDPARHAEWPVPVDACIGARLTLFGVVYRVAGVSA